MKRLLFPLLIVVLIIIVLFLGLPGVEGFFSELITDSANRTKGFFTVISFMLLALDVFLPIPSSIVMFFNGSVLGFFLGGCLSLLSSMTSSLIGYFFGKAFYKKINQKYSGTEIQKASFIINNYGFIGLILTRGVPILSEAVSILAGNMAYSFRRFFWANLIGYIPICWMYAFIGSRSMGQDGFMWAFGVNVFVAAILLGVNLLRPKERTVRTEN